MVLYSAVSCPLDRSKRFTLSSPGRPVHSDTVLGFSWKHSSHAAIAQRLFTHISTTVYSQVLIYTAESTEASWSERKCPNFETVTTGIRTRALSIASPAFYQLSYRAPQIDAVTSIYPTLYDNTRTRYACAFLWAAVFPDVYHFEKKSVLCETFFTSFWKLRRPDQVWFSASHGK